MKGCLNMVIGSAPLLTLHSALKLPLGAAMTNRHTCIPQIILGILGAPLNGECQKEKDLQKSWHSILHIFFHKSYIRKGSSSGCFCLFCFCFILSILSVHKERSKKITLSSSMDCFVHGSDEFSCFKNKNLMNFLILKMVMVTVRSVMAKCLSKQVLYFWYKMPQCVSADL